MAAPPSRKETEDVFGRETLEVLCAIQIVSGLSHSFILHIPATLAKKDNSDFGCILVIEGAITFSAE